MLDTTALSSLQPVISRPSHSRAFFSDALGLAPGDIHTFPDRKRLSSAIFDSPSAPEPEDFKYAGRVNIAELRAMKDVRLLEFGSLFGSTRLELSVDANVAHRDKVRDLMAFDQPVMGDVRDEIAERLGGAGSYIGLHLRVGGKPSDTFHVSSRAIWSMADPPSSIALADEMFLLARRSESASARRASFGSCSRRGTACPRRSSRTSSPRASPTRPTQARARPRSPHPSRARRSTRPPPCPVPRRCTRPTRPSRRSTGRSTSRPIRATRDGTRSWSCSRTRCRAGSCGTIFWRSRLVASVWTRWSSWSG